MLMTTTRTISSLHVRTHLRAGLGGQDGEDRRPPGGPIKL